MPVILAVQVKNGIHYKKSAVLEVIKHVWVVLEPKNRIKIKKYAVMVTI